MKTPSPQHQDLLPHAPQRGRPQPHSIPAPRVTPKQTPPIRMDSAASPPLPRTSPPLEPLRTLLAPLTPLSEIPFIPRDPLYLPGDPHHLFLLLLRRSRLAQAPGPPRRDPGTSGSLHPAGTQGVLGIVVSVAPSLPPPLGRSIGAHRLQLPLFPPERTAYNSHDVPRRVAAMAGVSPRSGPRPGVGREVTARRRLRALLRPA